MNLPSPIRDFLRIHAVAVVATISQDSKYPHVVPVFYTTGNAATLFFPSPKESKKVQNILAHPHITISITDSTLLQSLELKGRANILEDTSKKIEILNTLNIVATNASPDSFAPVIKLDAGPTEIIEFSIDEYRLSSYLEKNPQFIEGPTRPKY